MELFFKGLAAFCGLLGVATTIYNVLTVHRRNKERDEANRLAAELTATTALAIRTQERVNAVESRLGSFEQRMERRMDQMASDIGQVKDLFTSFLINQKH